jgi:hypothetical protein
MEKINRPPGVTEFEEKRRSESERIRITLVSTDRDEKTHPALGKPEFWERRQAQREDGDLQSIHRQPKRYCREFIISNCLAGSLASLAEL